MLLFPAESALLHQGLGGAGHAELSVSVKDSREMGAHTHPGAGHCSQLFPAGVGLAAGQKGHKMLGSTLEISEGHEGREWL